MATTIKQFFDSLPVKTGGTYVVSTRSQHWGRGDTLGEALQNARSAGAKSLRPENVVVFWQPDSAWQNVKSEYGDKTEASKPYIGDDGSLCSWGGGVEILHRPGEA